MLRVGVVVVVVVVFMRMDVLLAACGLDGIVSFESNANEVTFSFEEGSSSNGFVYRVRCTPSSGSPCIGVNTEDFLDHVLSNFDIFVYGDTTPLWIEAWGAWGGRSQKGERSGGAGYATTVLSVDGLASAFGTTNLYYLLGKLGNHGQNSGGGGAATIVSSVNPLSNSVTSLTASNT
eukprot:CAMPEP_0119123364 /NCGR_PEP_ID=MMETSP1310-20130426/3328_1 /TAXON_ID=464262 /ORGANISM="Genus nov. species nov., Strain RCC2339" /LENGTH=176 /DNA_ID=CAMNT_0007113159 /DNA_START=120 /DNA_END=647 /DNA_ORIENTATION=-